MSAVWDRDAAREVLRFLLSDGDAMESALDALEACVRPAPPQGIDRDALVRMLSERWWDATHSPEAAADDVLALLRPIEGVREELIDNGALKRVWAVKCDACNTWLSEWNSAPEEVQQILREHQDEMHD